MMDVYITRVDAQLKCDMAAALFRAYSDTLPFALDFQHFDEELATLPGVYAPPHGALLLAMSGTGDAIGCIGLRPLACNDGNHGELKRLYIMPHARGRGIARQLLNSSIQIARSIGYNMLYLDTLASMASAISLYESAGFVQIAPYYDTPIADTVFFQYAINNRP